MILYTSSVQVCFPVPMSNSQPPTLPIASVSASNRRLFSRAFSLWTSASSACRREMESARSSAIFSKSRISDGVKRPGR